MLSGLRPAVERGFCGCPACWVAHLLRAGRGLFPGTAGAWRRGAYSGCGWGWWRGMFRVSASGFPVCYEVDSSPLFNFNRIFPPFPGACRNLCAETSYLRVQCLCGRADVWGARAVGATILDVFG